MAIKNYAESWTNIYSQYLGTINFVAGDFSSIKQVLTNYISVYNPEQYTDWAESSEVGVFVNSLAYLGENTNYRVDLNVHDLFPGTTRRKESLLNFARLLSYASKRNTVASGIAKVVSVSTTQDITDSMGNDLQNMEIFWDDPSNANWMEQFLTIMNSSLVYNNQYGSPLKTVTTNSLITQLYQINTLSLSDYVYNFTSYINGANVSFEVINPNIDISTKSVYELAPKYENGFNILYRNDGSGNSSINTGFFINWKQGVLKSQLINFDSKIENNVVTINDANINSSDVWLEELNLDEKTVKTVWTKIADNEQLSYNNVANATRTIYKVETLEDDAIRLKFADGAFGAIPYGIFRLCYRISNGNSGLYIKPTDMRNVTISIPYMNNKVVNDTNVYYLTLRFSIQDTSHIVQSNATQTLASIRESASAVYSTQNRMVSASDYNLYPLVSGQNLVVLKSTNRTYSGNSRFINFNDPSGTYAPVNVLADDGYIYGDSGIVITDETLKSDITILESVELARKLIYKHIVSKLNTYEVSNIYYEYYDGYNIIENNSDYNEETCKLEWVTDFVDGTNSSRGHLRQVRITTDGTTYTNIKYDELKEFIADNDMLYFEDINNNGKWARIEVFEQGFWGEEPYYSDDSLSINDYYKLQLSEVYDVSKSWYARFKTVEKPESFSRFNAYDSSLSDENGEIFVEEMISYMTKGNETSFCITYDADDRNWVCIDLNDTNIGDIETYLNRENDEITDDDFMIYNDHKMLNWFFKVKYNREGGYWRFQHRRREYVFGSKTQTNFFFNTRNKDNLNNIITNDYIEIKKNSDYILKPYYWKPYNVIKYTDGYVDPTKFKARGYDGDKDASMDVPTQFRELSNMSNTRIIFYKTQSEVLDMEYLDFVDLYDIPDDITTITSTYPIDGTLWKYIDKSGYYYLKHKCNGVYKPYTTEKEIIAPYGKCMLSNGKIKEFSNETIGLDQDFVVVDCNISYTDDNASSIQYDDDSEGYLYYYDADLCKVTEISRDDYKLVIGMDKLVFMWKHLPNENYTVDPCPTNIIDMYALTRQYYNEVQEWINNDKQGSFPKAPTSYELKNLFNSLENNKSMSDTMIWHPVTYKLVFGSEATISERCVFKVVKTNDNISDNAVKRQIITLIDNFFATMGVGESFYFTQLSTYIHTQIPNLIESIVPVPTDNDETFGKMFEIKCDENEILLSSATLNDIQIISRMTANNLRMSV